MIERAPAYPFEPDAGGVWPMSEDDELCSQEIQQAVLMNVTELPMEKSVGSRFARMIFSLDAEVQGPAAKRYADDAIKETVGKVVVRDATVTEDGTGVTTVYIEYQRTTSDTPGTVSFEVTP